MTTPSLYTRLGGYDAIYELTAVALKKAMQHPAIGHIWAHTSESSFYREHSNFTDFLSALWGGKVRYRGRDLVTTHRGMGLTEQHWRAMLEIVDECYEEFGVAEDIRGQINASFEKLKPSIIGSPSYRDVVLAHPEMDVTKGMKSVGLIWPAPAAEQD